MSDTKPIWPTGSIYRVIEPTDDLAGYPDGKRTFFVRADSEEEVRANWPKATDVTTVTPS